MSEVCASDTADIVDPMIRRFITEMSASFSSFPDFADISHDEARRIAELVRKPWREGGPAMATTTEHLAPTPRGPVRIRVHVPPGLEADRSRPALVYLHGGGWTLFSLDTHDRLMREYAARADVVVIGVDYALSPEMKFPFALEQIAGVVAWLRGVGSTSLGVDPERLAIGGDSAGGNLSVAAALRLRDGGDPSALKAVLLNYAALGADVVDESTRRYGGAGFMLGEAEMRRFWTNYLASPQDARHPLAAPLDARLHDLPPTRLTIAECDVLADQNRLFAERLAAAGVAVEATVYAGATHSFLEAVSIAPLAARALQDGADWLKVRLATV
jgi:acetyl esterase